LAWEIPRGNVHNAGKTQEKDTWESGKSWAINPFWYEFKVASIEKPSDFFATIAILEGRWLG
jgi:hypothetical protein